MRKETGVIYLSKEMANLIRLAQKSKLFMTYGGILLISENKQALPTLQIVLSPPKTIGLIFIVT